MNARREARQQEGSQAAANEQRLPKRKKQRPQACYQNVQPFEPEPEWTPTYTLDKQLGRGRMSQSDWQALQDDWDETERLIGEAQKRYASHHNRALFKLECRRAIKRED